MEYLPPVTVSYFDEYGIWKHVESDIQKRLPLRNLMWRSTQRGVKTIPILNVDLKKFSPDVFPKGSMFQYTPSPFLHMYLVNCDDTDTYKQVVRKQIKDWVEIISAKKNQEWLIVYVSKEEGFKNPAKFLNIKTSVYDKVKSDFNTSKRDRCTQIRLNDSEARDQDVWGDFFTKLKEGILSCFDQQVNQFEDDIRRLDAQRLMPGWNYCQFFMIKEGLSQCFSLLNLHEDALLQYDELEASFFQTIDSQASSFNKFGATDPGDDSTDILDLSKKPYRDLLLQNAISVFDFKCYLFGQQCQLLFKLKRPVEMCYRARAFILHLARSLQHYEEQLVECFRESWIYSSCQHIVNHCDNLFATTRVDTGMIEPYQAIKAELLFCARQQLDRLGFRFSHITRAFNSIITCADIDGSESSRAVPNVENLKITNQELLAVCKSVDAFDELFAKLTQQTIKAFETGGRERTILLLKADLANLHFHRFRFPDALKILDTICNQYSLSGWNRIHHSLLVKLAACQKHLGLRKDFAVSCLKLVKASVEGKDSGLDLRLLEKSPEDKVVAEGDGAMDYVRELNEAAKELVEEIASDLNPLFSVVVSTKLYISETESDASGRASSRDLYLLLDVESHLATNFEVDKVSMLLVGGQDNDVWFHSSSVTLNPGKNAVKLLWQSASTAGNYVADVVKIQVGKLVFACNLLNETKKHVFRIHEPYVSLKLGIGLPWDVEPVCDLSGILLRIRTCTETLKNAVLSVQTLSERSGLMLEKGRTYKCRKVKLDNGDAEETEVLALEDNKIAMPDAGINEVLEVLSPFNNCGGNAPKLRLILDYINTSNIRHVISALETVRVWNPLSMNTFLYHRSGGAFLQVLIQNTDRVPVRLCDINLVVADGEPSVIEMEKAGGGVPQEMVLFHEQTCSVVFAVKKLCAGDLPSQIKLKVFVKHHYVNEEVESYVLRNLESTLGSRKLGHFYPLLRRLVKAHLRLTMPYASFVIRETEKLGKFEKQTWESALCHEERGTREELLKFGKWFFEEFQVIGMENVRTKCVVFERRMIFETVVGLKNVLISADLRPGQTSLTVTETCSCSLTINRTAYWECKDTEASGDELECYYDLDVDFENWMIHGAKRRRFKIRNNESKTFRVSLCPLKPGYLPLPNIRVYSAQTLQSILGEGSKMSGNAKSISLTSLTSFETQDGQFDVNVLSKSTQVMVLPQSENAFMIVGMVPKELVVGGQASKRETREKKKAGGERVTVVDAEMGRFSDFAIQL